MKILLIGEYSRLHNSLKEGLIQLGHQVTIVAAGDGFKNYPADYAVASKVIAGSALLRKFKNLLYRLTALDIEKTERAWRFYNLLPKLKGFDHVQLINSDALETHPALQQWLYKKLFRQNKQASLVICGDETPVVEYLLQGKLKYSVLSPYLEDKRLNKQFNYTLKYISPPYKKLFDFVEKNVNTLITSDLDYQIPMTAMGYKTALIQNPVNTDKIEFKGTDISGKIVIFLGINRNSYIKKGLSFFEEALEIVRQKHGDNIEIVVTENIPYAEYIMLYKKAHIILDQVYAYDQGYNALEAMAAGKVVFTGAETEFMQHYGLTEKVAINALPDASAIAGELSYLIDNPAEIPAIGKRARAFVEKEHHYVRIAERYVEAWLNPEKEINTR